MGSGLRYVKAPAFRLLPKWAGIPIGATDAQVLDNAKGADEMRLGRTGASAWRMRRANLLRCIR
jgi:hypothetical protein